MYVELNKKNYLSVLYITLIAIFEKKLALMLSCCCIAVQGYRLFFIEFCYKYIPIILFKLYVKCGFILD
jgi:hypothetical protein